MSSFSKTYKHPPTQTQTQPRPYFPPSVARPFIREKMADEGDVNTLFATMLDGDYQKIKNIISDKNISLHVRNAEGQSLIHIVLENNATGMKENHKYEIIKELIDRNAPISAQDKNNVTASHLACKYQYSTILKLLIENGADINKKDNLNMTPLHYAVQGSIELCKERKKVGSLIPKKALIGKQIESEDIRTISNDILTILSSENFNRYILHIKNTFINVIGQLFPSEFTDIEKEFVKNLTTIISDVNKNDLEKQENVKNAIVNFSLSLNNLVSGKLQNSTRLMDIGPHHIEGWGPGTEIKLQFYDKVLPKETPEIINNTIEIKWKNNIASIFKQIGDNEIKISDNVNLIFKKTTDIYQNIDKIINLNSTAQINSPTQQTPREDISFDEGNLKRLILYKNTNKFQFWEINTYGDIPILDDYLNEFLPKNETSTIKVIRGTKRQRDQWSKQKLKVKEIDITDDKDPTTGYVNNPNEKVGSNPTNYGQPIRKNTIPGTNESRHLHNLPGDLLGKPYYYVSKFIFSIIQIDKHYKTIKQNILTLKNHSMDNEYFYYSYHKIMTNILLSCYNIFQNILLAENEKIQMKTVTEEIKSEFGRHFVKFKDHPYAYLLEYCQDWAEEILGDINSIYETMNILYSNIITFIENINNTIDIINNYSGMKQLQSLLGSNFTDNALGSYRDIFDKPLKLFKLPPKNLNEYYKEFGQYGTNIDFMRTLFYEKYAPSIDIKHYPNYIINGPRAFAASDKTISCLDMNNQPPNTLRGLIDSGRAAVPINDPDRLKNTNEPGIPNNNKRIVECLDENKQVETPLAGYLIEKPTSIDFNTGNAVTVNGINNITQKLPYDGYGLILNNNSIEPSKNTSGQSNVRLQSFDNTSMIGNIGLINNGAPIIKTKPALSSVSTILDQYLYIIKFLLIQKIIAVTNDPTLKDNGKDIINPELQKSVINFKTKLMDNLNKKYLIKSQINPILFTTVGKLTDGLIISLIQQFINSGVLNYVNNFVTNAAIIEDYDVIYQNYIKPIDKTLLQRIPTTGFEENLTNLFDDILEKFYHGAPSGQELNSLMFTVNVMEEEETISPQYKIYDSNYRLTSEIIEKKCYKIRPEIIDLLANAKAYMNAKDSTGSSPIFYTIDSLHKGMIERLLDHRANIYIHTTKDNLGKTPYQYFMNRYKNHNGLFVDKNVTIKNIIERFTEPIYIEIKETLQNVADYKNNIIRYMNIIFSQLIIMYNNLLYLYTKSYVNNWTFEDQTKLEQLFLNNGLFDPNIKLPILQNINQDTIKHSIRLDAMTQKVTEIGKNINKENKQIQEYQNMITSLTKQKLALENTLKPYTQQINEEIRILDEKINKLNNKLVTIALMQGPQINNSDNLNQTINDEVVNINNAINDHVKQFIMSDDFLGIGKTYDHIFNHVSDIYNNIFKNVINTPKTAPTRPQHGYKDYFLYNSLWKSAINDNNGEKLKSIYNIHIMSSQMQNKLIDKMMKIKSKQNINHINTDLEIITKLHNTVFDPTINNMFDLSQNYKSEENYVLTEVLDIITHITKHVLCSNLYYAIIKTLVNYLLKIYPKDIPELYDPTKGDYSNFITNLTSEILRSIKLHHYILKDMPKSLVKLKTKIYESDFDEDRSIKSVDHFFNNIINIITDTKVLTIPKNSSLITNLENEVFKYYKDIFDLIIPRMKALIDNYSRFILNETRFLNVSILFNKTVEKEISN